MAAEHRGQVKFGGLPLPGATVTASRAGKTLTTITDLQGRYAFQGLDDGTWTIQVEMLCFETARREIPVSDISAAEDWELKHSHCTRSSQAVTLPPPAAAAKSGFLRTTTTVWGGESRQLSTNRRECGGPCRNGPTTA